MIGSGEVALALRIVHLIQLDRNTKLECSIQRETPDELLSWNTNILLSDEDQHRVKLLIKDGERNLDILDGELFRAWQQGCDGSRIQKLLKQREEEISRLKIMRTANSPIKRVPPEILGKIFMWYMGGQITFPLEQTSNPWKLSHVSSHWRHVLWNTPNLWENLEVALPIERHGVDVVGDLTIIRNAIHYIFSRGQGLHNLQVLSHSITPVADVVFPFAYRFKSLSIKKVSYGVFLSLLELPTGVLPFLETIILDVYYDPTSLTPVPHTSSLQAAPGLVNAEFSFTPTKTTRNNYSSSLSPYLPPLPWSQLTHLVLISVGIPWTVAQRILTECVLLRICNIVVSQVLNNVYPSLNVVLSYMETFHLIQVGAVEWDKFLGPFEFPCLKIFAIRPGTSVDNVYPMAHPEAINSLVLRSRCSLVSFSIGRHPDYRENRHLPNVTIPSIEEFLKASSGLKFIEGTLTLPASIFIAMNRGELHLPDLQLVVARLQPDGLMAFLDLLNSQICFDPSGESWPPVYSGTIRQAIVSCQETPGYQAALEVYRKNLKLYNEVGICLLLEPSYRW